MNTLETQPERLHNIVVCLSRDHSPLSWITYFADGGGYTHASIALDEESEYYYSFNLKGFKKEYITSLKRKPRKMTRISVAVTEEQYRKMKEIISEMESKKGIYKYSGGGVTLRLMCVPSRKRGEKKQYFCSEFVAKVLDESGAVHIEQAPGNYTPNDIAQALENSGQIVAITDDTTMKTIPDIAAEKAEKGIDVAFDFTTAQLGRLWNSGRLVPRCIVRIAVGPTGKLRTIYHSSISLIRTARDAANDLPEMLAKKTTQFLDEYPRAAIKKAGSFVEDLLYGTDDDDNEEPH